MGILNKIKSVFKQKTVVQYGGFELLKRLTGSEWSKGKMLEQYEKSLYVFACVYKIAEKVASTPIRLNAILNSRGDVKELINHPLIDLLYRPNPFQTKTEFLKITLINKKLCGDAFWYKIRDDRGNIQELWNLRPDYVEIIKDPEEFIKAYKFNKTDGTSVFFNPEDIVHFKYPTPLDEYFGTSPIKSAQTRIDTESYAGQFQRDFFLNNARPDGIIKANAGVSLDKEQKDEIREEFEKKHKGVGKNSRIAVVEGDLEYQQVSITQKEMDFIESMKFTRDDILVAFGVPKAVVAITDDVNRANAETAMYIFLSEVVKPEDEMLFEKINEEMVIPDYGENLFIDFPDPTPENREQTRLEYEAGLKNGYLLINEVRNKENYEPIDGGWSLYKPIGEIPVGGLTKSAQKQFVANWIKAKAEEANKKKLEIFRGKDLLFKKLVVKEKLLEELKKKYVKTTPAEKLTEVKGKIKNDDKKKAPSSLIKGDDIRDKYANMVIKQIDQRAIQLKSEMTNFARRQSDQLIAALKRLDLTKATTVRKRKAIGKETKGVINEFYKDQEGLSAAFIFPFIEEYARNAGLEAMALVNPSMSFEMSEKIRNVLIKRSKQFGLGVSETTRDKITSTIEQGLEAGEGMSQISDRINAVYDEFPTWRSDLIARTESTAANNEGFIEAYKQSGVATHKEWIATLDDRTRPEHAAMNGEIVKVGRLFSNGLQYPQEPNCRCVIGPAFEK